MDDALGCLCVLVFLLVILAIVCAIIALVPGAGMHGMLLLVFINRKCERK